MYVCGFHYRHRHYLQYLRMSLKLDNMTGIITGSEELEVKPLSAHQFIFTVFDLDEL